MSKKIFDTTKRTSLDVKIMYQIFGKPLHHEFLPTPLMGAVAFPLDIAHIFPK